MVHIGPPVEVMRYIQTFTHAYPTIIIVRLLSIDSLFLCLSNSESEVTDQLLYGCGNSMCYKRFLESVLVAVELSQSVREGGLLAIQCIMQRVVSLFN